MFLQVAPILSRVLCLKEVPLLLYRSIAHERGELSWGHGSGHQEFAFLSRMRSLVSSPLHIVLPILPPFPPCASFLPSIPRDATRFFRRSPTSRPTFDNLSTPPPRALLPYPSSLFWQALSSQVETQKVERKKRFKMCYMLFPTHA